KFGANGKHPVGRVVRWVEQRSTEFANEVITAGEPFRRRLIERNVPSAKVTVVMNSADPNLFDPSHRQNAGPHDTGRFRLMYHGGLFPLNGVDLAIHAVKRLQSDIPGLEFYIYGDG